MFCSRPVDILAYYWFARESSQRQPAAIAHFGTLRTNVVYRHNLLNHIGEVSTYPGREPRQFAGCRDVLQVRHPPRLGVLERHRRLWWFLDAAMLLMPLHPHSVGVVLAQARAIRSRGVPAMDGIPVRWDSARG
eukprot:COSAG01_NODE_11671_length_1883_cov_4.470852_1_plen_134_part_00